MVPGFNRSISFPLSPSRTGNKGRAASCHVRSVSLPCRSHPFISNLEEKIQAVRSWAVSSDDSSVRIETGLARIEALQTTLEEFLHLSQTQEILCRAASTDNLLADFLLLADIYSSFISAVMSLKQHQSEVQSSIRRADQACTVSALRSQRHAEKEIAQLASCLKNVSKSRRYGLTCNASESEITGILVEAVSATAVASMAVFSGVAVMSAAASSTSSSGTLRLFRKLAWSTSSNSRVSHEEFNAFEKLQEQELSVRNVEIFSERVYGKLINLRVSLLNISTPL